MPQPVYAVSFKYHKIQLQNLRKHLILEAQTSAIFSKKCSVPQLSYSDSLLKHIWVRVKYCIIHFELIFN